MARRAQVQSQAEVSCVAAKPSRRQFSRISTDRVVLVTTVGDADAEQPARTRNVSLGGSKGGLPAPNKQIKA